MAADEARALSKGSDVAAAAANEVKAIALRRLETELQGEEHMQQSLVRQVEDGARRVAAIRQRIAEIRARKTGDLMIRSAVTPPAISATPSRSTPPVRVTKLEPEPK